MVSTRERAIAAAMAALDRRNPNLDDFVGLNWSSWVDGANSLSSEGLSVEECSKYGKKRTETMTLGKEDMPIYGHCPTYDDFFLVVCSHCGQVVKPQAFELHCERRHGPVTKLCSQYTSSAPEQRPRTGRSTSILSRSARERQKDGKCHGSGAPLAALVVPQDRPAKVQKEVVSVPPVDKLTQESAPSPTYSSAPCPRVPPWHTEPLPPGALSSSSSSSSTSSEKPTQQKPVTKLSDFQHNPLPIPRTYSRTYKKVCKKECDLDKHCGVLDPERKKLCTRQLMCNIHSIHQRRKVVGRSKAFDQLVMEQRAGSKGQDSHAQIDSPSHSEAPEEEPSPPQLNKRNRGSSCPILRHSPSRESLESNPEEEEDGDGAVEVEIQPPYPFNQSLLSSEESEGEEQEEARDLPATPWHPKPLGLCTFGSHTLGCSLFTFDRRLHHLRFALSAMVEHHISAHLWKKIPQVSTGLRRYNTTSSSAARSSVRRGARASPLTGSSLRSPPPASHSSHLHRAAGKDSCSSTSSGQSETKSSQINPPSTKPPSSSLLSASHGRQRNPIGRPSKARLRELELLGAPGTVEKAAKPSRSCAEDQSSKHIREQNLHEKGPPPSPSKAYPSPSSQGPINGTISPRKKPCPSQPPHLSDRHSSLPGVGNRSPFPAPFHPPHPSPRRRGRPPGLYGRVVAFDHRRLAKRRKTSDGSPPPNVSLTRTPRSATSHSSLFSWKGENMAGVLSQGMEKTIDPQRTKLH